MKERSKRLHWVSHLITTHPNNGVEVFSVSNKDHDPENGLIKTYILDTVQKKVIVLEVQRSKKDYHLLTAYYLNKTYGLKQLEKKKKKKLPKVY